jgi:hypothetical protein
MIIPSTNYPRLRIAERVQQRAPFGSLINVMEG